MSQSGQYLLTSGASMIQSLTGDTGGAVGPTAGNINIVGADGLVVSGNPGTSTLTIEGVSYVTDAGTATPTAIGGLNVLGGTNINTAGAANNVTVNLDNSISLLGTVTAGTGIESTTGNIRAVAGNLYAGGDLDVVGTVTFTNVTDGVLIADGIGEISSITGTDGQVVIGSTGADPVFNTLTAGAGITIANGAGTITISSTGAGGIANTHTIAPSGAEYTTIQAALDDNVATGQIFLVYPGAYSGDTINFTANDQMVIGVGGADCQSIQIVSAASADMCDFGAFTGCVLKNLTITVSGATAAVSCVKGSTGSIVIENTILNCTNSSVTGATQPSCISSSGAATVSVYDSCINYTNAVAVGANVKSALKLAVNSSLLLDRVEGDFTCSNTSAGGGFYFSTVNTDLIVRRSIINVADPTGGLICGFYYVGTSANTTDIEYTVINVATGLANNGVGIYSAGTSVISSTNNRITVTETGGVANSFVVGAGSTINSTFDDTLSSSGPVAGGTFTEVSSDLSGNFDATSAITTATVNASTVNTNLAVISTVGYIGTATSAADYYTLSAYDVDGAAYVDFVTLTANNTPTCDLSTSVTMGSNVIYYATGTDVPVTDGGTGASSLTDHGVLVGSGTAAVTALTVGTNGQVLVGSTGADPVFANITSGDSSITISEGAGTLDLTVTGGSGSLAWTEVTGTTQAMAVHNGYILNNVALVTATLPATAAVGSIIRVVGKGAGGWTIAQNAGQSIVFNTSTTTVGVGGSLSSTNDADCVELVCTTANTTFTVMSSIGNITVV